MESNPFAIGPVIPKKLKRLKNWTKGRLNAKNMLSINRSKSSSLLPEASLKSETDALSG